MLLLSALLLGLAQQPTPAQTLAVPPAGSPHIEAPSLGFVLDLPEGLVSHPDVAAKIGVDGKKAPDGAPCASAPVIAIDPTALRRIAADVYRKECLSTPPSIETLRGFVMRGLTAYLKSASGGGLPSMTSPMDYTLGKHPAAVVTGTVYSAKNHGILFAEAACFLSSSGDPGCFYFTSSSRPKLQHLAALPLTLDGHPAVVVPESVSRDVTLPTNTYRDEILHFDYEYPGIFADTKAMVRERLADTDKKRAEEGRKPTCMDVLASAEDLEDAGHTTLLLWRRPASCARHIEETEDNVRSFARNYTQGRTTEKQKLVKGPLLFTVGGHLAGAIRLEGTDTAGKPMTYYDIFVFLQSDFVMWQLNGTDPQVLDQLARSKVAIDGKLAVPLVPEDTLKNLHN